jgi:hypothetical protein
MGKIMKFLEGKKTYITMAVIAILGGIGALNEAGITNIQIPEFVFSILALIGIYTRKVAK